GQVDREGGWTMADTYTYRVSSAHIQHEATSIYSQLATRDANKDGAITRDEVQDMDSDTFNAMSQSGKITQASLCTFVENQALLGIEMPLKANLPPTVSLAAKPKKDLPQLIQKFDTNKDGKVDRHEFDAMLPAEATPDEADARFKLLSQGTDHLTE